MSTSTTHVATGTSARRSRRARSTTTLRRTCSTGSSPPGRTWCSSGTPRASRAPRAWSFRIRTTRTTCTSGSRCRPAEPSSHVRRWHPPPIRAANGGGHSMENYRVARLEQMEEIDDGREPYRAVRHHLGITAFGVTALTGRKVGDRILNEHDETDTDTGDRNEELYLVLEGRARFELDGEPVDAAAG